MDKRRNHIKRIGGILFLAVLLCGCQNAGSWEDGLSQFSLESDRESLAAAGQGVTGEAAGTADSMETTGDGTSSNKEDANVLGAAMPEILPAEAGLRAEMEALFEGLFKDGTLKKQENAGNGEVWKLVGNYGIARYNAYSKDALEQFYGEGCFDRLPWFELREDGTGTLWDNGDSLDFSFYFDDNVICLMGESGGTVLCELCEGEVLGYWEGNEFAFSPQKRK